MGKFIALALIVVAVIVIGGIALGDFQDGITSVSGDVETQMKAL